MLIKKIMLLFAITITTQFAAKSQGFKLDVILDQEVSCKGNNDGSIQATCIPEGNYKYVITRGKFTDSNPSGFFRNLVPGVYSVTATNGKVIKKSKVTVTEPKSLGVKFIVGSYPISDDLKEGSLSIEVSGGTTDLQPYLIIWTNSEGKVLNENDIYATFLSDLKPDKYSVKIEDDHGCFLNKSYQLKKKK
jgi:hypothetical protein